MASPDREQLNRALIPLKILIVPKNIAVYDNNDQIIELFLSRFGIKEIPENFFSDPLFRNVKKLHLNSNKLTNIPGKTFSSLENLEYLNLSRNYLRRIPKALLEDLHTLKELDLSNNAIFEIEEYSFNDLQSLKNLILKNNQLENLPAEILSNLSNLNQIDLSINKFRKIPSTLTKLYSREVNFLDLKGNFIPYEFAKTFTNGNVIHSFLSEVKEYWNSNVEELHVTDIDAIIKQYLFDALMSVYHYAVNVPVLNYSLLNITLGYMTKNFHLLIMYLTEHSKELSFRQNLFLWYKCLDLFGPMEQSLVQLLNNNEIDQERKRRILERKEKKLNELENEVIELGGIIDYKFKKSDITDLEPVHENLFKLIKEYLSWNTPKYSTIFL